MHNTLSLSSSASFLSFLSPSLSSTLILHAPSHLNQNLITSVLDANSCTKMLECRKQKLF